MRKTLISIIGVILLILVFVAIFNGISIGKLSIYSVKEIKDESLVLDNKIEEADTKINQEYASSVTNLESSIKTLKTTKAEYENKIGVLNENTGLGITQIEQYKIEYLWGKIGTYESREGLKLELGIKETSIADTYDLNFTVVGSYMGIVNFLYDIENDDELNYKVKNFKMSPTTTTTTSTSGKTTTISNSDKLKATFVVESIIINFK